MVRRTVVSLVGFVSLSLLPATTSAQSAASGIAGVVKDTTGAVIPGVSVEAASPALIERVRTVVSDAQGLYKIVDLRPGIYTVTFTLPGFNTIRREGIELPASFTATVNAEMRVGSLEETVTVSGEAPTVDVQNIKQQKVLSQEVLNSLPSLRTPQSYVPYIPGVQGGLGQIGRDTAALAIHGSRAGEANVAIDGFEDHSLQGTGGGAFIYYINQGSVQEVSVEVAGQSAEQQMAGIRTNLIPKEGSNTFSGFLFLGYGNHATQADNLSSDLRARGLTSVNSLAKVWDVNPAWGGRIFRDKLWFYNAYRYWGSVNYIAGLYANSTPNAWTYTPDYSRQATTRVVDGSSNLRLTWQVTPKNKVGLFYDNQPHCTCNRNFSSTVSPEATQWAPFRPNQFAQGSWKWTATNRLLIEAGISSSFGNWQTRRQPGVATDTISATEQSTQIVFRADSDYGNHLNAPVITRAAATYVTGSHAAKFGMNFNRGRRIDTREMGGQMTVSLLNGVPRSLTQYASPWVVESWMNADFGLFAQDQWTLRRLTLNVGLRYDYFNGGVPAQDEGALLGRFGLPNPLFVPVRSFPAVNDVPHWRDLSPRLGAAYDLFGDGKTAIKVSLSRYVIGQSVAIADANNPLNTSVTSAVRTWTDANGNFVADCDLTNAFTNGECGQLSNLNFGKNNPSATRYADDVLHGFGSRGFSWETSIGFQRELRQGVSVSANYFRRWYGNFSATVNTAVDAADFTPYCITAPVDSRLPGGGGNSICGFYDVNQNKFGQVQNVITQASNFGKQRDVYDGVDLIANIRLPKSVLLSGGLNTGRERTNDCFALNRPQLAVTRQANGVSGTGGAFAGSAANVASPRSPAFCDIRPPFQTQLKFFAVYPLPWWGLQTAATFQSLPGPQITASHVATNADIRPSLGRNLSAGANGTVTVDLVPPGTLYGARANELDFNVKKFVRIGRTRVSGSVDVFNLLNRSDVLTNNTRFGPLWLQPTNILAGRWIKFGGQVDF